MAVPNWRQGDPIPAGYRAVPVPQPPGMNFGAPNWQLAPIPGYQAPGAAGSSGATPATSTGNTAFPTIPNFGLPDIAAITAAINQMTGEAFRQAEGSRIPGQAGLEDQSSAGIQQLLSPAEYFPGTSREVAEIGGQRGFQEGAPSLDNTWVRRTRDEQLREMALGQQFLTGALGRHPIAPQFDPSGLASYLAQLPGQRAQLLTQQQQFAQSQQQARELALAQMENAARIALLNALRGGRALTGGGGYPNFGGFPQAAPQASLPRVPTPIPSVTPTFSDSTFPDVNAAFPQIPLNQGWDLPVDFELDLNSILDQDALYA
jgi:hypothetical protein